MSPRGRPGDVRRPPPCFSRIGFGVIGLAILLYGPHGARGQGTWVDLNPNGADRVTVAHLKDVDFFDASSGVVVGENGTILATVDRGDTWTNGSSGTSVALHGVHMLDATTVIAVGQGGTILRSTDGGVTWTPRTSNTSASLSGIHFVDATTGATVGHAGTILRTVDGGLTWTPQYSGVDIVLSAVFLVDSQLGFAVGSEGQVLRTVDGGAFWNGVIGTEVCNAHHGATLCNGFRDLYFLDASTGFVTGWPADPVYLAGGSFLGTSNGGTDWSNPYPPIDLQVLAAVSFGSGTQGMVLTQSSAYHTHDAGVSWTQAPLPTFPGTLHALSHGDAFTAYAVGDNGTITRWETVATPVEKRTLGSVKAIFRK